MIKYRKDPDLELMQFCDNEDLEILVDYLTKNKEGELRFSEKLTLENRFKNCHGNYKQVWYLIAGELQLFGADTVSTFFRGGKGVFYREILIDVCKHLKVKVGKKSETSKIEEALLLKVIEKALDKMTEKEKIEFTKTVHIDPSNLSVVEIMAALQAAIRSGGFASYQIAIIVANNVARTLVGKGLAFTANVAFTTRYMVFFSGPIGWVISGLLSLPMISGPAYRVTIPSVIQIAYMRQKYKHKAAL